MIRIRNQLNLCLCVRPGSYEIRPQSLTQGWPRSDAIPSEIHDEMMFLFFFNADLGIQLKVNGRKESVSGKSRNGGKRWQSPKKHDLWHFCGCLHNFASNPKWRVGKLKIKYGGPIFLTHNGTEFMIGKLEKSLDDGDGLQFFKKSHWTYIGRRKYPNSIFSFKNTQIFWCLCNLLYYWYWLNITLIWVQVTTSFFGFVKRICKVPLYVLGSSGIRRSMAYAPSAPDLSGHFPVAKFLHTSA